MSATGIFLSYVVPVHNEEKILRATVAELAGRLGSGSEILLIENGSSDSSYEVAKQLQAEMPGVRAFQEPSAGLGFAYRRGIREARGEWIVLTAADLPFGFTDLDGFLKLKTNHARVFIGSKAHLQSHVPRGWLRNFMSFVFRAFNRIVLQMRTGDPQGSFFIYAELAKRLEKKISANDFFFTTELTFYSEKMGENVVEMPIVLREEIRKSTVRPFRDGSRVLRQLLRLRSRSAKTR